MISNGAEIGFGVTMAKAVSRRAGWYLVLALSAASSNALALPSGKAWIPPDRMTLPGFYYLAAPRLDFEDGFLRAATLPRGPGLSDARGFRWSDSLWVETWRLGYGTLLFWPVLTPPGETHLIWCGATNSTSALMAMARVRDDVLLPPDTVAVGLHEARTEYGAAVGAKCRWAAVADVVLGSDGFNHAKLRLFISESAASWREVPISGEGGYGVSLGVVDDSTALVVWASPNEKLQWGILRGEHWEPGGLLHAERIPERPRLRKKPSGGFWLTWGTVGKDIFLCSYDKGLWSEPVRITADYPRDPQDQNFAEDTDMSRDDAEFPVIVWDASYEASGQILISYPDKKDGYSQGEMVPGSFGGVLPSVARDSNGDVWLTWWEEFRATWWTHTYTHAIPTKVAIEGHGRNRSLVWTLDEPAPDSWWAVLRACDDGAFEEVARVQAGPDAQLTWTDKSPPGRHHRYRVRRACLDKRYEVESEVVAWPPRLPERDPHHRPPSRERLPLVLKQPGRPLADPARLEIENAAPGEVELALYDLQGRRVVSQRIEVANDGRVEFPLARDSKSLGSGIYFARVRDSDGVWSPMVRVFVLR